MKELTSLEISIQDYVDGVIFELIQSLNPTKQPTEWNIEMIGDIRDTIEDWVVDKPKMCTDGEFYSYIPEQNGY